MKRLYVKNYKGFEEQIIELKDVNFFVGENSTGKTSILKLINIINSSEFWFSEQFNNNEVELGYFDEILNRNTTDNYFRIGLEIPENDGKIKQRILLEFREHKSIPKIHQIKYCTKDFDSLIKITAKQIHYKNKPISEKTFCDWVNDFSFKQNFKKMDIHFTKYPLFIIFSLIENQLVNNKKNDSPSFLGEPTLYKKYRWMAPIRAKAKRIYESYEVKYSPEGEHIPSILRELFSNSPNKEKAKIRNILNQFGKESNLFDEVLVKNYGSKKTSPFEIIIKYEDTEIKLPNVGYGVSQSLPLIVEILSSKEYTFSIQQPEVHLHPKAQAAFGSFLFNATLKDKNNFLIETHSDFTINRFRYCLSKNDTKIESQILFFERNKNTNSILNIAIDKDGAFIHGVPDSYREFFIDEELKLLEL